MERRKNFSEPDARSIYLTSLCTPMEDVRTKEFDRIATELLERHISLSDRLFTDDILESLCAELKDAFEEGAFHKAEIGKGLEKQRVSEIRGDHVYWLSKVDATPAQNIYWSFVESLMDFLSDFFRIHLERTELHFARYPEGGFYAPHVDQFREQSNRIFSVILYLNQGWRDGDGGELRIHSDTGLHDIQPLLGRFVIFRSDTVLHEVLQANRPRMSITGWMRRDTFVL